MYTSGYENNIEKKTTSQRLFNTFTTKLLGLKRDKYGGPENIFKLFGLGMQKLDNLRYRFRFLHGLIFEDNKYRICKAAIGLTFGIIVGLAFYEFILTGLFFLNETIYTLGMIFTAVLGVGCMLFTQIRCVTLLCLPTFLGKAGRNMMKALIISTIVSGPVSNIIVNVEEIMRMVSCTNSMAYNMSQARYNLLVKPFKMAFLGTKIETEELRDTLESINNVVEPISQEIEGEDDVKFIKEENDYLDQSLKDTKRSDEIKNKYRKMMSSVVDDRMKRMLSNMTSFTNITNNTELANEYQQKYYKKLELRCENVKTSMTGACQKTFYNFYDRCMDTLSWTFNWAVCWAVKLDFICDVVKMFSYGNYDCDPSTVVSGSVGKEYVTILHTAPNLKAKVSEERTQYKIHSRPNFVSLHSVVTITKKFYHDITTQKNFAEAILKLMKTFLAFMFIFVIISASRYHDKFKENTDFDNIYVTSEFRIIDAHRYRLKKKTVLPLMKVEQVELADPYAPFLGPGESKALAGEFNQLFFLCVLCSLAVTVDLFLATALSWMADNLEFSYKEQGEHAFKLDVIGVGFIASVVRSIIKGFDFTKTLKEEMSNRPCLPIPKYLPVFSYVKIFGSIFHLYLMAYCEGYISRLRRAICAFYYRDQEKRRIVVLYTKTLQKRQQMIDKNVKELADQVGKTGAEADMTFLRVLYMLFPRCHFLRLFPMARPQCAICKEAEAIRPVIRHSHCTLCDIYFCSECWHNFNETCVVCYVLNRNDGNERNDKAMIKQ